MVDQGASAGNGLRHITKAIHATRRRPTVPGSRSRLSHTIRECADLQQVLRALIAVLGSDLQVIAEEYGYLTLDPATRTPATNYSPQYQQVGAMIRNLVPVRTASRSERSANRSFYQGNCARAGFSLTSGPSHRPVLRSFMPC